MLFKVMETNLQNLKQPRGKKPSCLPKWAFHTQLDQMLWFTGTSNFSLIPHIAYNLYHPM